MKKIYALLLAALILFAGSCKKDESKSDENKNPVLGKWQLTESLYTLYKNGELKHKDENALNGFPVLLEFNPDGTGTNDSDGEGGTILKFRYSVADTAIRITDRKLYEGDKIVMQSDEVNLTSTKRLSADKWFVVEEATTDDLENSVQVKNRQIYKNTWTRIK